MCELEGEITYQDPRTEPKSGQSEAPSSPVLHKRDAEGITTIPSCNQCNQTVWIGGKTKSTFLGYFQVNNLYYDNSQLEMCRMGRRTY